MAVAVRAARGLVLALGFCGVGLASVRMLDAYPSLFETYAGAARSGNHSAQKTIGFVLAEGGIQASNPRAAVPWLLRAANSGDAEAQAALGDMYREGRGVDGDFEQAGRWYRQASATNMYAAWRLGQMYEMGQGVTYDCAEALLLYTRAARAGLPGAQNSLGNLYFAGIGVQQDYRKALEWYSRAADQGFGDALLNLAGMFMQGLGVERSYERAHRLAGFARDKHSRDAQSFLDEIERER